MDPSVFPDPSPGVAQAIAEIDFFLAELRLQLAIARRHTRTERTRPARRARRTRRRLLRLLARPGGN
jgi:hypothetical protein